MNGMYPSGTMQATSFTNPVAPPPAPTLRSRALQTSSKLNGCASILTRIAGYMGLPQPPAPATTPNDRSPSSSLDASLQDIAYSTDEIDRLLSDICRFLGDEK